MGVFGRLKQWVKDRALEDEMRRLTDNELKDMGISRYELEVKALKTRKFGT